MEKYGSNDPTKGINIKNNIPYIIHNSLTKNAIISKPIKDYSPKNFDLLPGNNIFPNPNMISFQEPKFKFFTNYTNIRLTCNFLFEIKILV